MTSRTMLKVAIALLTLASVAAAEPTQVTIRVLSKGGKFIGTSMGGAQITIKDVDSSRVLASGVTAGGTGDTARIMTEPRSAKTTLFTEGAAQFQATIDLDEPRLIEVTAYGPLSHRHAANRVSATQWIVPGRHITAGDAWLLEIPGLVVEVQAPPAHVERTPKGIKLKANVTMMCGCPLGPDTSWNIDDFEVRAIVKRDGKRITEIPLTYAGVHSQFEAEYAADQPGAYEAIVYAYQHRNGNTGLQRLTWVVDE
jgi:hypothetical protein